MHEFAYDAIFGNVSNLPSQFFPGRANITDERIEPMKRLAFAVLLDAIRVLQANPDSLRPSRRSDFDEAREWVFASREHGPFSFENVCYLVGIEPSQLRKWLLKCQAMERVGQPGRGLPRRVPANRRTVLPPRLPRRS